MATRRQLSREFNVEAVELATERGIGVNDGGKLVAIEIQPAR